MLVKNFGNVGEGYVGEEKNFSCMLVKPTYHFTNIPYSLRQNRLLYFSGPYTLLPTHIFINIFRQHKIDTLSPVTGPGSHTTLQFFNLTSDLYFDHATMIHEPWSMNLLLSPFSELVCKYTY